MKKTCERCGAEYETENRRRRYCGVPCYRERQREAPNAGTFKPGLRPWNKDVKGLHLSPATEFKPGPRPEERDPVGTVKIRQRRNRVEAPRAFVKIAQPNVWKLRAVAVWEKQHGPLPRGMVVHHKDRDSLNDVPENLVAFTRAEHLAEHRRELLALKAARMRLAGSPLLAASTVEAA